MHSKKVHFSNSYPDYTDFNLVQLPRLKFIQTKIKNDKNNTFPRRIGFERSNEHVQNSFREKIKFGIEFLVLFLNSSSIHGLSHLTKVSRHPVEIIIWLFIVGMASFGVVYLSLGTWKRFQNNPIVISMERDRFAWNTTFPSVTFCPKMKINTEKLDQDIGKYNFTDTKKAKEFIKKLAQANYTNFKEIPEFKEINSRDYLKFLIEFAVEFRPILGYTGTDFDKDGTDKIITEVGICYSFNSQLAQYSSPEYWASGKRNLLKGRAIISTHPLEGEVVANLVFSNATSGLDMYVHGPEETFDIGTRGYHVNYGYFLQLYLYATSIYTSDAARQLTIAQRKCRFFHESNLKHSPVYSYNLCRIECRIQFCLKKCNCIPHFYRPLDGEKVCDVKGLHCLDQYKKELITLEESETGESLCNCLPNCDYVKYVPGIFDSRVWFLGTNAQWGLLDCPRMRLKRDILFGFTDVLVNIGGMAGFFMGCSVLSFAEIIYFLTIRLFWFVVEYRKQTHILLNK